MREWLGWLYRKQYEVKLFAFIAGQVKGKHGRSINIDDIVLSMPSQRSIPSRMVFTVGTVLRSLKLWRSSQMKFAVTVVSAPGYIHSAAFGEVAESIHHGLQALGHDSVLTTEGALPGRRHIVLGSNLLPTYPLPLADDAILYNLEQVDVASRWFRPEMELLDIFRRFVIWDYSQRNAAVFRKLGVKVACVVPIGYVKELTRLQHLAEPDIDVLFFGTMNDRRQRIIGEMCALGLRVKNVFGIYGRERDALICRAKLILNVHFFEAKVLEIVRISYLLANRCVVLSERSSEPDEDAALAEGVAFADYHHLARRARELIDSPDERRRLAQRGFELIKARPTRKYLRAGLEQS